MGFFDEPSGLSGEREQIDYDLAAEIGMPTATRLVLLHTEEEAVILSRFSATRVVLTFDVAIERRVYEQDLHLRVQFNYPHPSDQALDPMDPRRFRLGIQFSDGLKVTNLDPTGGYDDDSGGPRLLDSTTSIGGNPQDGWRCHGEYHVFPVPPPGPTTFVCEWPALGIPESRATIDGQVFQDAANQAIPFWGNTR